MMIREGGKEPQHVQSNSKVNSNAGNLLRDDDSCDASWPFRNKPEAHRRKPHKGLERPLA